MTTASIVIGLQAWAFSFQGTGTLVGTVVDSIALRTGIVKMGDEFRL